MPKVLIKRGTRSQITAAASAGGLSAGECYLMTDEGRLSIATASNAFADTARLGEGQIMPFIRSHPAAARIAGIAIASSLGSLGLVVGRIQFVPHCEPRDTLISSLGISITTSADGVAWLGVYDNTNATGYDLPGALLRRIANPINLNSTGLINSGLTSPLKLIAGRPYWFAYMVTAPASIRAVSYNTRYPSLGYSMINDNNFMITSIASQRTFSELPNAGPQNYSDYVLLFGTNSPAIFMS